MTLPASLAFYLDHASQVDELVTMEKPSDVSPEDWRMFQDVYGWACGHVEAILDKARAGAKDALSLRAKTTAGNTDVRGEWDAWCQLKPTAPSSLQGDIYLGVSMGIETPETVGQFSLTPYLVVSQAERREGLHTALRDAGFSESVLSENVKAIHLREIPLRKDTDLDAAIAESTECFRLLAERWEKVFSPR
ncbi:MAG: hypothetical protein IPQ09_22580 [Myxococcales bacterium]|nr:hypothetical protein [Myxococcales bacterium]